MTDNAIIATGGYNNPQYCAQMFHFKVERCMEIVKAIFKDVGKSGIPAWLFSRNMKTFTAAVRSAIREHCDSNMDTWPKRVVHDYVPDAHNSIHAALEDKWELFQKDGYDEFIISELVYKGFYN